MANTYSVRDINRYLGQMFDTDFLLRNLQIKGEVSNCKYQSNGNIYFKLKDQGSLLNCMMWASNRSKGLSFVLEDGMQVVVGGYIKLYEAGGYHQLYATKIEQEGQGALYLEFLALKQELEEMGMFAPEYKQPIPKLGRRIGVVTASTGAVIHDIETTARNRNPYVELYLYPAKVQGIGASDTIAHGIEVLDQMDLDVIIVGRGGGSIEDLWAFNERIVADAIFAADTPIISAVGHETDFTICDFVADRRVATPTAAAELAVASYADWMQTMDDYREEMYQRINLKLYEAKGRLLEQKAVLGKNDPAVKIATLRAQLNNSKDRLEYVTENRLKEARHQLAVLAQCLEGQSPLKRLQSGFGYVGITSIEDVTEGDTLEVAVSDGFIDTKIIGKKKCRYE